MNWLGIDVGGANIKIADGRGFAGNVNFPLWQKPQELTGELRRLIAAAPRSDGIALTMTGELADCFATKREGVLHILNAVERAAESRSVAVYLVDGRLVSLNIARAEPLLAAASNWHVLARFVCRLVPAFPALLVDIGSTTTDVIPLNENGPSTPSRTDTERLLREELVYMGISRTPLAAMTSQIPYRGEDCPVAAELFATAADVAVLIDVLPEQPKMQRTADGRPLTKDCSRDRIARMICADRETFSESDAREAALDIWKRQTQRVQSALERVIACMNAPPRSIIVCGVGEALGRAAAATLPHNPDVHSLSRLFNSLISSAAPAHALAILAAEMTWES